MNRHYFKKDQQENKLFVKLTKTMTVHNSAGLKCSVHCYKTHHNHHHNTLEKMALLAKHHTYADVYIYITTCTHSNFVNKIE